MTPMSRYFSLVLNNRLIKNPLTYAFLVFIASLFLFSSAHADALSRTYTDSTHSTGNNAVAMVAIAGSGVTLDAPSATYKVAIPTGTPNQNIEIRIIAACGTVSGYNSIGNTSIEAQVYRHATAGFGPTMTGGAAKSNASANCSGNNLVFTVPTSEFSTLTEDYGSSYRVALLQVRKTGGTGIRSFRVQASLSSAVVTAAEIGNASASPGQPSAVVVSAWDGRGPSTGNVAGRISYYFSPNCNFFNDSSPNSRTAYLKWFDADVGASNQPQNISWQLIDIGNGSVVASRSGSQLGANGEFREAPVTLIRGRSYEWRWENVNRTNGIQVWVPFSEITTLVTCADPIDPVGYADSCVLSGNNTIIYGWAYDDNASTNDGRPRVTTRLNGGSAVTDDTDRSYRNSQINSYLDTFSHGNRARDNRYGFAITYSGLTRGNTYNLSGTVLDVGPGSNQALGINTSSSPPSGGVSGSSGFPGSRIPDACLPNIPPTTWDYRHYQFNDGAASGTTYPLIRAGTSVTIGGRVRNYGTGTGANNYDYRLRVSLNGGSTWSNMPSGSWTAESQLASGATSSPTRSATYTIPSSTAPGTIVCFRGEISPYLGTRSSSGTISVTSSGWRVTSNRCVEIEDVPTQVTINPASSNCTTLSYNIIDPDTPNGFTVQLLVDGLVYASFTRNNQNRGANTYGISRWRDLVGRNFEVRVTHPDNPTALSGVWTPGACVTVNCEVSPLAIEANDPFSLTVTSNNSATLGSEAGTYEYEVFLRVTGLMDPEEQLDDPATAQTISPTVQTLSETSRLLVSPGAGRLSLTGRIVFVGAPNPPPCNRTAVVTARPYVRFYGNDVIACGTGDIANINVNHGYVGGSSYADYRGSASQLAVMAAGINGKPLSSNPVADQGLLPGSQVDRGNPWALAFANSGNNSGGTAITTNQDTFGGELDGNVCGRDVDEEFGRLNNGLTPTLSSSENLNSLNGRVGYGGGGILSIRGNNIVNRNIVLVAESDLLIDGNITLNGSNWSDTDDIPSVILYVDGDVYIDSTVSQVHANIIATGDIHTCSSGSTSLLAPLDEDFIANSCAGNLVIEGSLRAGGYVHFLRTTSSVLNGGSFDEAHASPTIAESVRFNPEIYVIPNGAGVPARPGVQPPYDSIIARPPSF